MSYFNETRRRILGAVLILHCVFLAFVSTSAFALGATVPQTGQTTVYGDDDDGDLREGVTWPIPRFVENGNGTVTDSLTNLVWLQNGNCFGTSSWITALANANALKNGDCGLTDGSAAGNWRLPNVRELEGLIHIEHYSPAIPNSLGTGGAAPGDPFVSLFSDEYWSSTTNLGGRSQALVLQMRYGHILSRLKTGSKYSLFVKDNGSGTPIAPVYATGQTKCYNNIGSEVSCVSTGQDGELRKGAAWPIPRFTDNNDGTIKDNLTGLAWLKNANCWGASGWYSALDAASNLGSGACGLSDGTVSGDWRLPNKREIMSLIDFGNANPALSNSNGDGGWTNEDPFIGVVNAGYWSSSTYKAYTVHAWYQEFKSGVVGSIGKDSLAYFLPVRDAVLTRNLSVSITGDGSGTVSSSPSGIACPGDCSEQFEVNSTITLTAHSAQGSRFDGWSLPGCGKRSTCSLSISSSDQVITASFADNNTSVGAWILLLIE